MHKSIFISFLFYIFHKKSRKGRVGSPQYMPPEAVTRRQYGKPSDIWAAGIMLHILLSGRLPFIGSGRRLQESILRGRVMVSQHIEYDVGVAFLVLKGGQEGTEKLNYIATQATRVGRTEKCVN